MAAPETVRTMRADARANRDKLLQAAGELFASAGSDVPLESIARAAGVGIGTLYRHFPTRDALIEAAYRNEVDQLCGAAQELLAAAPADDALAAWMERFVDYAATKRGLGGALKAIAATRSDLFPTTRDRLLATLDAFLDAGHSQGAIRADVNAEDVFSSMNAIWAISDGPQWQAQARRVLRLLIDGLRFGARAGSD